MMIAEGVIDEGSDPAGGVAALGDIAAVVVGEHDGAAQAVGDDGARDCRIIINLPCVL